MAGGVSRQRMDRNRRRLRIGQEQVDALEAACPEFTEEDLVVHVRDCDTCTKTLLRPGLFTTYSIALIADKERIYAVAEPGTAAVRFTTYRPCETCGAEIFGTRQPDQPGVFWANRLDKRLHDCADFRVEPDMVEPWSRSVRRPGRASRTKR